MIFLKKYKIVLSLAVIMAMMTSCADEELAPILTFESAGKGAFVRLVQEGDKLINLFDVESSAYTFEVEFVDEAQGANVSEYVILMTYSDNNPDNGDASVGPVEFRRFGQGDFSTNANGFVGVPPITITSADVLSTAGTNAESILPGDEFNFSSQVIKTDGSIFTSANSSATVATSAAFASHFTFTLPVGCPSDLTGTYTFTGSEFWCGNDGNSGEVDIIALGGGTYAFSDWSFGGYLSCYGSGAADAQTLTFTDVCAEVSFTGFTDSFGDTWTFTSSVEGNAWTITWENTYGESGTGVITNPSGDWAFTLAE